ncbi:alpha/beta hydrolase [uncultured Variovorax sp.]|uniref:alpha/beta hydrolase n=1 Tax=uncultured Variovorax sp. TaxID=114708 RepID=UPI0025CE991E|nr:alpha/beta hydrolase [uncultured Variovorax sp.]
MKTTRIRSNKIVATGIVLVLAFAFSYVTWNFRYEITAYVYGIRQKKAPPMPPTSALKEYLCSASKVSFSPSGNFAVFERGERRLNTMTSSGTTMQVADLACLRSGKSIENCATHFSSFDGIRPFAWHVDEKALFAIENESALLKIAITPAGSTKILQIEERIHFSEFRAIRAFEKIGPSLEDSASHLLQKLIEIDKKIFKEVHGQNKLSGATILATGEVGLFAKDENLQSIIYVGKKYIRPPAKEPTIHSARISSRKNNEIFITGTGFALDENGKEIFDAGATYASKPIMSPKDGAWLGWFDLKGVRLSTASQDLFPRILIDSLLRSATQRIEDFSVSDFGDFAAVVSDSFENKNIIFWNKGMRFTIECPNPYPIAFGDLKISDDRSEAPSVDVVSLGSQEWPLYAIALKQSNPRGLAIVFGGGPGNTSLNQLRTNSSAHMYRRLGYNVLIVDYSSSPVYGLSGADRLRIFGISALEKDAGLVERYVRESKQDRNVVIHGESFGGLPAIALSSSMQHAGRLVLLAPFLRYLRPEEWVLNESGATDAARSNYQRRWDSAVMGVDARNPQKFASEMQRLVERRAGGSRTFVAFGNADPMSRQSHVPRSWDEGVNIHLFNGNHEMLPMNPQLWPTVAAWLMSPG